MSIRSLPADNLPAGWSLSDAVMSIVERFAFRAAARRRYRTVRRELLEYSQHQLAELGIREADIDFVAGDASR